MIATHWTGQLVEAYLVGAATTLQQAGGRTYTAMNSFSAFERAVANQGLELATLRTMPAEAVNHLAVAAEMLRWLEPMDRDIAWRRACGRPWKQIAWESQVSRTTLWRRWSSALASIAARLNAAGRETTMQHLRAFDLAPPLLSRGAVRTARVQPYEPAG